MVRTDGLELVFAGDGGVVKHQMGPIELARVVALATAHAGHGYGNVCGCGCVRRRGRLVREFVGRRFARVADDPADAEDVRRVKLGAALEVSFGKQGRRVRLATVLGKRQRVLQPDDGAGLYAHEDTLDIIAEGLVSQDEHVGVEFQLGEFELLLVLAVGGDVGQKRAHVVDALVVSLVRLFVVVLEVLVGGFEERQRDVSVSVGVVVCCWLGGVFDEVCALRVSSAVELHGCEAGDAVAGVVDGVRDLVEDVEEGLCVVVDAIVVDELLDLLVLIFDEALRLRGVGVAENLTHLELGAQLGHRALELGTAIAVQRVGNVALQEDFVEDLRDVGRLFLLDGVDVHVLGEDVDDDDNVRVRSAHHPPFRLVLVVVLDLVHVDEIDLPMLEGVRGAERLDHGLGGVGVDGAHGHRGVMRLHEGVDVPTGDSEVPVAPHALGEHVGVGAHVLHVVHEAPQELVALGRAHDGEDERGVARLHQQVGPLDPRRVGFKHERVRVGLGHGVARLCAVAERADDVVGALRGQTAIVFQVEQHVVVKLVGPHVPPHLWPLNAEPLLHLSSTCLHEIF
eukprot:908557-Pyramimonas_sp.AAC.1